MSEDTFHYNVSYMIEQSIFVLLCLQRQNQYDGVDEYYVLVKETGQHEEEETQEEIRKKRGTLEAGP